jgi:hypothetical protein
MTGFIASKYYLIFICLLLLLVRSLVLLDSDITILLKVPPSVGVGKGSVVKLGWEKQIYILSAEVSLP